MNVTDPLQDPATGDAPERRIDTLIAHYAQSHQNATNEALHCICVPLIMFSLVGLIYTLHPLAALAFLSASMVYYLRLSARAAVLMSVWSSLLWMLITSLQAHQLAIYTTIFVVAWIGQFIGHKLEGKKPSFFEDLQYLWVGPLFVAQVLLRRLGWHW
ncbi:Mpo1-like protein [Limnohabitans sp.]|jgi:uncharacterized membrane protein YGL010W|uniref:Mpo1 family 2-hydroxy fatty acid dioxygenase n=1 Tax=Limnohabitans sp. TaxID=1907725 RepID=UPI00286F937B|nr:Mpo1-like protein [Limnohabitans sp.]